MFSLYVMWGNCILGYFFLLPRQYGAFLFIVVQYGVFPPFSSVSCHTGWGLSLLSDCFITNMAIFVYERYIAIIMGL